MGKLIIKFTETGDCNIDVKAAIKRWGKTWFISQWQNTYRLCHRTMKIQISELQANEIIVALDLTPVQSPVFRSAKTWTTDVKAKELLLKYAKIEREYIKQTA